MCISLATKHFDKAFLKLLEIDEKHHTWVILGMSTSAILLMFG